MHKTLNLTIAALALCAMMPATSRGECNFACCYEPGDNNLSGDAALQPLTCENEEFRDYFWAAYDFDEEDWNEGFGFGAACDIEKPLNRTYNAIAVLHYSAPDPPTESDDFDGNILRWGGNFAMDRIDELDARCGSGSKSLTSGDTARTRDAGIGQDAWTRLFWPFFYGDPGVIYRAGSLIHEARHYDGFQHEGVCGQTGICDFCFNCIIHAGGFNISAAGPNTYEVVWLWWFHEEGARWTQFMRDQAKDHANLVLISKFVQAPVNEEGNKIFQIE